jgi:hypothetical protein
MKRILLFTFATAVTNDSTFLWLPLVMCLSLVTNVSFDELFTNGTRGHVVRMVTFETNAYPCYRNFWSKYGYQ